jgi:GNAT superfamily N-acetyltransferase
MNLDDKPIRVFGAMELCVDPSYRKRGIGKALMTEFEKVSRINRGAVDFLFLATDIPKFYSKLGYKATLPMVLWHRLHQHKSFGIAVERVKDCTLMFKRIGRIKWTGKQLDMLGYWY